MKKMFKNAILTCLFALCCVFIVSSSSFMGVKVNAVESENQEHTHVEEIIAGKEATCSQTGLTTGVKCSECGAILFPQEVIEINPNNHTFDEWKQIDELIEERKCIDCGFTETREIIKQDDEVQEQKQTEIEKVLNDVKNYIIALIVAFLGSGGLMAIAKAIIDKWFSIKQKELELKVGQLEEDKKIATEEKDLIVSQFAELKQHFFKVLEQNVILCDYIKTKIKVDEEKEQQINKLLEELLPKEENTDEK